MKMLGGFGSFLSLFILIIVLVSCSEEQIPHRVEGDNQNKKIGLSLTNKSKTIDIYCQSGYFLLEDPVAKCSQTSFGKVLGNFFLELLEDPLFDPVLLNYYTDLNRKYVTFYEGVNYYGKDGEFNKLAEKRQRELTRFWNLDREIYLNGQHTRSLNDRESLAAMIESFDRTIANREEAYEKAEELIAFNKQSSNYPGNPIFAMDAFTKSNGLLVIGDGILDVLIESGIEENIAFTGILAHEWWHQAQFQYSDEWNYINTLTTIAEISRFTELEADFAASYFLAHKRGATFNWKRIEEFFELSFNVGDCLISSNDHHGTPAQRLSAAEYGFKLAESAQKKGKILSPQEIHAEFLNFYPQILNE